MWVPAVLTAALLVMAGAPYALVLALYAAWRPEGPDVDRADREPTVSVLLPTYNEADIVEGKLRDLLEQDYPMDRVEVVVVDASEDDTAAVVRSFFESGGHGESDAAELPALRLVEEAERGGAATALNRGVEVATGEVVLRTDADSTLDTGALRAATAVLADPDVGAVTGRQLEVLGESQVEADYRDLLSLVQAVESRLDSTFVFHGPCGAFEREAFEPVPADAVADDTEAAIRIRRGGKRVVFDPAMGFAESGVSNFADRRQRKDRRARGLVQVLWRHRDALGTHGRYGRAVLPLNWWLLVAGPWLWLAAGLAATWSAVAAVGVAGLALPAVALLGGWLGQRDALGPLQPVHAVLDSQASLLAGQLRLLAGRGGATWDVDRESREVFE